MRKVGRRSKTDGVVSEKGQSEVWDRQRWSVRKASQKSETDGVVSEKGLSEVPNRRRGQ